MRIIGVSLAGFMVAASMLPALAQSPGDQIEGVIGAQIEALGADDFITAFDYASPGIRTLFETPDRFGVMVRQGYPMVWRPDQVTFLGLREAGGRQLQEVMIRDMGGTLHRLEYSMVSGPDGWRIDGVRILEMPQTGA